MSETVASPLSAQPIPESIDGREFLLMSSSGSTVSIESPTRFRYHQDGQMIWGEYRGDTVKVGRFVGRREGDSLFICFAHRPHSAAEVVLGTAQSTIQWSESGTLELSETFEKDGQAQISVCSETDRLERWPDLDPDARSQPLIDGTSFALEESSASSVSAQPTTFEFTENSGVVWGFYSGDTVSAGHCVGRYRDGALDEYFVHHVIASDATLLGDSSTTIRQRTDGRLELIEEFVLDGVAGASVCVQLV